MYNIEGTKMVLVCHGGSSKPEKMYLEQACSSRAEKVSCTTSWLNNYLGINIYLNVCDIPVFAVFGNLKKN